MANLQETINRMVAQQNAGDIERGGFIPKAGSISISDALKGGGGGGGTNPFMQGTPGSMISGKREKISFTDQPKVKGANQYKPFVGGESSIEKALKKNKSLNPTTALNLKPIGDRDRIAPPGTSVGSVSDDGETEIYKALKGKLTEGIEAQKDQTEEFRTLLEKNQEAQENPNLDISPLLKLADTWFGGNLSAGYARPETGEELQRKEAVLQQALNKQLQGISDDELKILGLDAREKIAKLKKKEAASEKKQADIKQWEWKNAGAAHRARQTEEIFEQMGKQGYDRTNYGQQLESYLPDSFQSGRLKEWTQAELNFVNALLRQESGASINSDEYKRAEKQYFPRPGDSPQTLANKKRNRMMKMEELRASSGGAYSQIAPIGGVGTPDFGGAGSGNIGSQEAQRAKAQQLLQGMSK